MTFPDASTRLAAVIGRPVGHSISPAIHNAALRHEGRNAIYLAFEVEAAQLQDLLSGLAAAGAAGVNVTIPHKEEAARLADDRSAAVNRIGAANTLVFRGSRLRADNTDVHGIAAAVSAIGLGKARRVLLLGAGGSARAAAWAVGSMDAEVIVANRTPRRAEELVGRLRDRGLAAHAASWDNRGEEAVRTSLVINCTSVGMDGADSPLGSDVLAAAAVGGCSGVLDLVYAPDETPLVRTARSAGLVAADGASVLVHQAAEAYRLFWDATPSLEVMADAAAHALGRAVPRPGVPPLV